MNVLFNKERQKVPVKIWSDIHKVESAALEQLKNISSLPFVFKHVAAMPDVHLGKGATVGSVIATDNAVIPAAVGVDIGCGMMAIKTDLNYDTVRDNISAIRSEIERTVPVAHHGHQYARGNWEGFKTTPDLVDKVVSGNRHVMQMGTLGGGNHFIELCTDTENNVWIMLHSGSRNVGKSLAEYHMHEAKGLMKQYMIHLPDPDLAYFVEGTKEFQAYIDDLNWCQEYAMENRVTMMRLVVDSIKRVLKIDKFANLLEVNCHHNYTNKENHFGKNVWLTRKGAVRARLNEYGIIPGSMGTRSYIVRGLGSSESFCSCSHGAGRIMSRSAAKKQFTTEDVKRMTEGVECRKDAGVIDEIPAAYKDIDEVMENQKDLVEPVAMLKQFMCIKG